MTILVHDNIGKYSDDLGQNKIELVDLVAKSGCLYFVIKTGSCTVDGDLVGKLCMKQ